jgi:hypothetical protein
MEISPPCSEPHESMQIRNPASIRWLGRRSLLSAGLGGSPPGAMSSCPAGRSPEAPGARRQGGRSRMELTDTTALIAVLLLMAVWGLIAVAVDQWAGRSDLPPEGGAGENRLNGPLSLQRPDRADGPGEHARQRRAVARRPVQSVPPSSGCAFGRRGNVRVRLQCPPNTTGVMLPSAWNYRWP